MANNKHRVSPKIPRKKPHKTKKRLAAKAVLMEIKSKTNKKTK